MIASLEMIAIDQPYNSVGVRAQQIRLERLLRLNAQTRETSII